jgi:salicylate hydroxylase
MAIEDAVCLAELIGASGGDHASAFVAYEAARCVRTARVQLESRIIWEIYHAEGVAREALWQQLSERKEQDVYQCLAWLYDGVSLPPAPRA